MDSKYFLSATEVAKRIGCSRATIYNWMAAGKFPQPTTGCREDKNCRWSPDVVETWIDDERKDVLSYTPFVIEQPGSPDAILKVGITELADYLHRNPTDLNNVFTFRNELKAPLTPEHLMAIIGRIKHTSCQNLGTPSTSMPTSGVPERCPELVWSVDVA